MKPIFFDHIYLVNLRQHRGQRLRALAHLKTFGINPTVFEATDGYLPPVLSRYETYSKRKLGSLTHFNCFNKLEIWRNKLFIDSPGAFGYIDTYIRILKDAKLRGYQSILIFEDDVLLSVDFSDRLETFYSTLPDTWKFIGLGASQYGWDSVDLELARSQGYYTPEQLDTCGSFAIAIRDTIYDELIQLQSHFEAPFDHLPLGEIYNTYPADCFVAYPNMVMPDVRSSSIRGSRNQLIHAQKMKWEPSLFDYPPKRPIINLILTSKEQIKYLDSFNEENTFPFELHLFIPSLDGLRPFHNNTQDIEVTDERNLISSPNSGYCVKPKTKTPFTEDDLISLYDSLTSNRQLSKNFEIIDTINHKIDSDRVSVIIPTYKRPENLRNVLLSVIEQDYENKEIIVVDDNFRGSHDQLETERVVSCLIEEHPSANLIYISQSRNRNGAGARNTGYLKSTGNYICFLDDDDFYLPGRLSLSIDKLRIAPRYIGAVYCGFIGWNSDTNTNERYDKSNLTQELLSLDYLSHYLHTNTATYKRDAINTINGFDETFIRHQDLELNLRFFEHYEMSAVPEQLVSLGPEPTKTDNRQSGIDLFETKLKFLEKFQYIINRFDFATKKAIYNNHWSETIKCTPDVSPFKQYLVDELSNGHLQCYIRIEREDLAQTRSDLNKTKKDLSAIKYDFSNTKSHLNTVTSDLTQSKSDLEVKRERIQLLEDEIAEKVSLAQMFAVIFFAVLTFVIMNKQQTQKLINKPKMFFRDSKNKLAKNYASFFKII